MQTKARESLSYYLSLHYPFSVIADPGGDYVIVFPDLPGCVTQVENLDNLGQVAEEIRTLWLETAYADGREIPLPSQPEQYSGKFNLRLPKSLHRELAEAAEREGVSLNQYVVALLASWHARSRAGGGEAAAGEPVERGRAVAERRGRYSLRRQWSDSNVDATDEDIVEERREPRDGFPPGAD